MLTNINLAPELESAIQLRATSEGRAVQDVVADLLVAGLGITKPLAPSAPVPKALPVLSGRLDPLAKPTELNPQEWSELLKNADLQLEIERYETATGHQHVDRSDS
ncbi:hypothetical protein [Anatilimnocola floriformis]|uniref:hypothetical protein n=1 Tax=Anatilimnocola floriformis TaxID=2948575 RepID=UPI0020C5620B|nr:hypothetical protein [Anatilimnocola floriformis]